MTPLRLAAMCLLAAPIVHGARASRDVAAAAAPLAGAPRPRAVDAPAKQAPARRPVPPDAATDEAQRRCASDERAPADRARACVAFLALSEARAAAPVVLDAERADAIRALHALGRRARIPPRARRALGRRLDRCVVVAASPAVVCAVCRVAMCGDAAAWHPFEFVIATGERRSQTC